MGRVGKTLTILLFVAVIIWAAWTYMPLLDASRGAPSNYSSASAFVLPTINEPGRGSVRISDALGPILHTVFTSLTPNGAVVMAERTRIASVRSAIETVPTSPAKIGEIRACGLRVCALLQQAIDETASADARKKENFFAPSDNALVKRGRSLIEQRKFFESANEREWRSRMSVLMPSAYRELAALRELESHASSATLPSEGPR
jgi:hypothetical protein